MSAPDTIRSARPAITTALMAQTGLDDATLSRLVQVFYDRVRSDPLLGPVFAERITDWGGHLERMADFWSSVALMTGRYHGAPMAMHLRLPLDGAHFDRWLHLFWQTARELCPPAGADRVTERAERIAAAIHTNIVQARGASGDAGSGDARSGNAGRVPQLQE